MLRIKWLLPLLLLAIPSAHAATPRPYWTNRCASPRANFNVVSTISCKLSNVVAGRTILVEGDGAASTITVSSPTETLTCPAGATGGGGATEAKIQKCYVVLASSHSSFTVTTTASGGFGQAYWVAAREMVGLGAFDTSATCGNATNSCSLTTANAGEWVDVTGAGFANDLVPHTGFAQQQYGTMGSGTSSQLQRSANWFIVAGGAGSQTAQFDVVSALNNSIAAFAFQVSSPPALPAVTVTQSCTFAYDDATRSSIACPLHNYVANDIVIFAWATHIEVSPIGLCSGPNCDCPLNSSSFHLYNPPNISYGTGICYGFDTVNIGTTVWGPQTHFGSGQSLLEMETFELSGVNTTVDTGSEANAAALTVNYTTIQNNEYTVTTCFDNAANPLIATAPAIQSGNVNDVDTSFLLTQQTITTQVTALAGSGHTTACSETSSSVPLIATLSFGIISSPSSRRKQAQIF